MSYDLNTVQLQGRLCKDAELRQTPSGVAVTSFTIAVQKDANTAYFFDCVAWRGTAETIANRVHKGEKIIVTGELTTRKFMGKDGKEHTANEINVEQFYFCGGAKKEVTPNYEELPADEQLPF